MDGSQEMGVCLMNTITLFGAKYRRLDSTQRFKLCDIVDSPDIEGGDIPIPRLFRSSRLRVRTQRIQTGSEQGLYRVVAAGVVEPQTGGAGGNRVRDMQTNADGHS